MVVRFIRGTPYSRNKSRGRIAGAKEWSIAVQEQTRGLRTVKGACVLDVLFILPADRFPEDHPHGNDLDNLLKRLLDALGETVLREAPGKDGAIMELSARKRKALGREPTGARIKITRYRPGPDPDRVMGSA